MSIWLIASFVITIQIQISGVDSLSAVYHRNSSGRKLFGGYRIVPKTCVGTTEKGRSTPKTGVCMFNYECNQRGGEMVGSCVDGFLFGACCSLPQSAISLIMENEYLLPSGSDSNKLQTSSSIGTSQTDYGAQNTAQKHSPTPGANHVDRDKTKEQILTDIFAVSEDPDELFGSLLSENAPQHVKPAQKPEPILEQYLSSHNQGGFVDGQGFLPVHKYPVADTILVNPDGSVIVDEADPELVFTRFPSNTIDSLAQSHQATLTNHDVNESKPEKFGYLTSSYMQGTFSPSKPQVALFGAAGNHDMHGMHSVSAFQQVTKTPHPIAAQTEFRKTTTVRDSVENSEKYPATPSPTVAHATSENDLILVHTLSNLHKTVKPSPSTSKSSVKYGYTTEKLPKPTVSGLEMDNQYPGYHYESYVGLSKPPIIITSPIGFDGSGQAISHILGILNNTHGKPDPIPADQTTESSQEDGGLSTWISVSGDKNKIESSKNKYSTASTKPPGTTTNLVHGPSFTVEEHDSKPIPTVIVISPPSTDTSPVSLHLKPFKKPVTSSLAYATKTPVVIATKPSVVTHNHPDTVQILSTGEESLISFPPVRNPDLNVSSLNQVEKPTIVQSGGYPLPNGVISSIEILSDSVDLNTVDPDEDYSDFTTPAMEDEKVEVKIHTFVEKIVNSLAGNFQDLESVLFRNENKTKLTNQNGIELNNVQVGILGSVRPPSTTKKPVRKPTQKPHPAGFVPTTGGEAKPRPSTKPPDPTLTTVHPGITTKKPLTTTKLTTTVKTTRRPATSTTTKKPATATFPAKKTTTAAATAGSTVTRKTTTKRPKPVTSTTTTEAPTEEEEIELTTPEISDSVEHSTVDFRRECGVRPLVKKGGRIVGGKGSQFGHYPWQVLVRESTWLGLFTKNKCGGVLITHKYVITAAHCQPGFLASLVAVFGEYDISGDLESKRPVTKNIRRVIVHRQYDPATFENDLALLELDSPISYDEHIVPICMPRDGEDYTGRMATVTGWGRLKYGGGVPSVLQEVRVPLIDNSVCQEMFHTAGHQKRIISSFLCAGYANGQKDSCEGDSGGPLMVEREDGHWVLLGTVSHGIKCAAPYLPGVYMRTTYYKPWLKSITGVST